MNVGTMRADESSTCGRCAAELSELTSIDLLIECGEITSNRDWDDWQSRLEDLFSSLIEGPVHVLVFDAPGGRYLQMQLGHGRGRVEVRTFRASGSVRVVV